MTDSLLRAEAEHAAEQVIQQSEFTTLPICPFAIARRSGILVEQKRSHQPGVSGFLMRVGNTFGISYASHIVNEGFIRFTIAHELGHYFLPGHPDKLFPTGDGLHQSRSGFIADDPIERQADYFASALLMPESLFRKAANRAGSGFPAIQKLAEQCKTSLTATAIRYALLTDDTVAVVVSDGNRIDYCFMSDRIRDVPGISWIRKGDAVPARTATARFNRDPANTTLARQEEGSSHFDEWFDGGPDVELDEDVVGLGAYGKTLTILCTDADLNEEDDDDDE